MKDRIEQLERIIPKAKANKKILPKAIECMEWELRALKAEQKLNSQKRFADAGRAQSTQKTKIDNTTFRHGRQ